MMRPGTVERADLPLAVVVGAGGMGTAVARRLAQRYRVLLADVDAGRAEAVVESLRAEGAHGVAIGCDVTDAASVATLATAVDDLGGFRALAHVAGLSPVAGDFAAILRVNLRGPALVAEALLPRAPRGAAAVLVASLAAHGPAPSAAIRALLDDPLDPELVARLAALLGPDDADPRRAYQLSKQALLAYCRRAAPRWGARGARIVTLSPGLIATPMGAREFENSPTKYDLLSRTPLGREGSMLEIADAVEFLLSDRASFISGTDLLVDGGVSAALGDA